MPPPYATIVDAKVEALGDFHAGTGGPVLLEDADEQLRQFRYGKPLDRFDPEARFETRLDGEFNYVGLINGHFGHVMAEIVHRILPSRRVFHHDRWLAVEERRVRQTDYAHLGAAYRGAVEFLGVNADNLTVINRNTVVAKLNIHQQQSQLGRAPETEYLAELDQYSTPKLDAMYGEHGGHSKIYVSRTGMKRGGNILGESYLTGIMQDEGFNIFQPELHPLPYQMDVYRKAEKLVFSEGSACHGVELLGPVLRDVFLIQRRAETPYIFDSVFAPRAKNYQRFRHPIYLGTAALHPSENRALAEWGVSLLDVERFLTFMRETEISPMRAFDRGKYYQCALADLELYVAFHQEGGSRMVPQEELDRMRRTVVSHAGLPDST